MSRDTWGGDVTQPLSYNKWNYVQSNPINYQDPTGNTRVYCSPSFNKDAVKSRVDVAEYYVGSTSDPIDTYVAAGIAIQCAGWDEWWNPNSGVGIAQITKNEAETESGEPIYEKDKHDNVIYENGKPVVRSYGLRSRCPDGELEKIRDPNDAKNAIILMKRRIQLVTKECAGCTNTDIYIAAGLAQNGAGFNKRNMDIDVKTVKPKDRIGQYQYISRNWYGWFETGQPKNNQVQLRRFNLMIDELINRGWPVPYDLSSATIKDLPNVKVIKK